MTKIRALLGVSFSLPFSLSLSLSFSLSLSLGQYSPRFNPQPRASESFLLLHFGKDKKRVIQGSVLNLLQKNFNSFLAFANTGLHVLMLLSCNAVSAVATFAVGTVPSLPTVPTCIALEIRRTCAGAASLIRILLHVLLPLHQRLLEFSYACMQLGDLPLCLDLPRLFDGLA